MELLYTNIIGWFEPYYSGWYGLYRDGEGYCYTWTEFEGTLRAGDGRVEIELRDVVAPFSQRGAKNSLSSYIETAGIYKALNNDLFAALSRIGSGRVEVKWRSQDGTCTLSLRDDRIAGEAEAEVHGRACFEDGKCSYFGLHGWAPAFGPRDVPREVWDAFSDAFPVSVHLHGEDFFNGIYLGFEDDQISVAASTRHVRKRLKRYQYFRRRDFLDRCADDAA